MHRGGGRGGGRGGRGGGGTRFLNKEQLIALGATGPNELNANISTQPPPLFPTLFKQPIPIEISTDMKYMLMLREDFIDRMQLSPSYLKPVSTSKELHQETDKLLTKLPNCGEKFDWNMFPTELRPKNVTSPNVSQQIKNDVDVQSKLKALEKLESNDSKKTVTVTRRIYDDDVEDEAQDEMDIEMDDGTDYANNYFDNGEDYEDEDDNLDDGPIY